MRLAAFADRRVIPISPFRIGPAYPAKSLFHSELGSVNGKCFVIYMQQGIRHQTQLERPLTICTVGLRRARQVWLCLRRKNFPRQVAGPNYTLSACSLISTTWWAGVKPTAIVEATPRQGEQGWRTCNRELATPGTVSTLRWAALTALMLSSGPAHAPRGSSFAP